MLMLGLPQNFPLLEFQIKSESTYVRCYSRGKSTTLLNRDVTITLQDVLPYYFLKRVETSYFKLYRA